MIAYMGMAIVLTGAATVSDTSGCYALHIRRRDPDSTITGYCPLPVADEPPKHSGHPWPPAGPLRYPAATPPAGLPCNRHNMPTPGRVPCSSCGGFG